MPFQLNGVLCALEHDRWIHVQLILKFILSAQFYKFTVYLYILPKTISTMKLKIQI